MGNPTRQLPLPSAKSLQQKDPTLLHHPRDSTADDRLGLEPGDLTSDSDDEPEPLLSPSNSETMAYGDQKGTAAGGGCGTIAGQSSIYNRMCSNFDQSRSPLEQSYQLSKIPTQ
ncbi:hypothetical protein CaCOL14_013168 [Colletotrichum acutatum]